jgi:hypothetical protein
VALVLAHASAQASEAIDHPRVEWQKSSARGAHPTPGGFIRSGGRLQIGRVGDITSLWWATSYRYAWATSSESAPKLHQYVTTGLQNTILRPPTARLPTGIPSRQVTDPRRRRHGVSDRFISDGPFQDLMNSNTGCCAALRQRTAISASSAIRTRHLNLPGADAACLLPQGFPVSPHRPVWVQLPLKRNHRHRRGVGHRHDCALSRSACSSFQSGRACSGSLVTFRHKIRRTQFYAGK